MTVPPPLAQKQSRTRISCARGLSHDPVNSFVGEGSCTIPFSSDSGVQFTFTSAMQAERMRALLAPPRVQDIVPRKFTDGVDLMLYVLPHLPSWALIAAASDGRSSSALLETPLQHGLSAAAAAARIGAFCEVATRRNDAKAGRPPAVDFVVRDASMSLKQDMTGGFAVELVCDADSKKKSLPQHIGYFINNWPVAHPAGKMQFCCKGGKRGFTNAKRKFAKLQSAGLHSQYMGRCIVVSFHTDDDSAAQALLSNAIQTTGVQVMTIAPHPRLGWNIMRVRWQQRSDVGQRDVPRFGVPYSRVASRTATACT
jgi:hypothetical protein